MTKTFIKGVIVPLLTPVRNGKVDDESLKRLIDQVIDGGVDALFIVGTTGEFQYLSLEEKKKLILKTVEFTQKRVPILVGIASKDEKETLDLADFSQENDIDALVQAFMDHTTKDQLLKLVLSRSRLPIILYNNPEIHNNQILDLEFIKRVMKYNIVAGIKDSSGDWEYFSQLLKLSSDTFPVYQGKTNVILESLRGGAAGLVNGYANIEPALLKRVYKERTPESFQKVADLKKEVEKLASNSIKAMKMRLVELKIITSAETLNV